MVTTILVVDDEVDVEPLLLSWFRRKIQQETYAFRFARNGREALTHLQSESDIDLVLLDINMPEMDGLSLLAELPALNPLLRAVMVSAYGDMENIRSAMNRGAFDFVCKPIDFTDLDVTIEKAARHVRQLHESHQLKVIDELKTRFFDNITHEFRTPLTLILSPVEQLLQRYREPTDLHQSLRMVERNAQQLLQLINQLLDLAKLESGHLTVSPKAGDLGDFLAQIMRVFEPVAQQKNLTLTYQNDLTDFVAFDADKLEQIVHNLLVNAFKFTQTGHVAVRLTSDLTVVRLTVTDTGIGIRSEKLPYIFNRFYQVQPADTNGSLRHLTNPGTGIGLALVKELTELMGGCVSVSSVPTGTTDPSGTTFTVELPLLRVDPNETGEPANRQPKPVWVDNALLPNDLLVEEEHKTEWPLVLVVEDNLELCAFIARELTGPYRVLTAMDGDEGWKIARNELPDLILTDIMMPGMDGYELTRKVKSDPLTDHIAVVMLTAKTAQTSRIEGLQQGADDYIAKPFHVEELRLRLHNLLTRQQTLRLYFQQQFSQPDAPIQPETVTDKFIQKLYTIIESKLDDSSFRVNELAQEVGMSSTLR